MYQNFYFKKQTNTYYIWDDVQGLIESKYEPYAYQIDTKGEFKTLNGLKVKRVTSWDKEYEKKGMIFEHDVPIATRVLIDNYFESDEPSINHRILYFDIEIEKGLKYSTPKEATNIINSIAYSIDNKYTCLLLDKTAQLKNCIKKVNISDTDIYIDVNVQIYTDEKLLLLDFVKHWIKINPTIVTGWNSEFFDLPYLYNRLINVLGQKTANRLSPIGIVEQRESNKKEVTIKIAGVAGLDYLQLYKKFTYNVESSYSLEAIAQKELKRGKIKYEGTLDDLYNSDIDKFIEYNINDVELLLALDAKKNLIETVRGICHAGHVPYDDFQFSSRYLEGAALTYCKRQGLIAFRSTIGNVKDSETAEGALVKNPLPGLYEYVIDLDLTSLYPSLIRTLNLSPETIFGKVHNWSEDGWIKKTEEYYNVVIYSSLEDTLLGKTEIQQQINKTDFWQFIIDNNLTIASNGVLFTKNVEGFLPSILTHWFNERKRLSKLAEEYGIAGDHDKYKYYDQKQLIQKILLNSFYGVLLLPSFRFYNKDIGESVTLTGQSVISYTINIANKFCNAKLNTEKIDYVIAGDTDSIFLAVKQIVNPNNDPLPESVYIQRTLDFAKEIQTYINTSYDAYAKKLHNVTDHYLNIKQEMIARRGFFRNVKKRYALWIINKKGVTVDEEEIKGLDVVRSSFPKAFRGFMKNVLYSILRAVDKNILNKRVCEFKTDFKTKSIFEIMLPSGVKEISKFKNGQKGTPIHVKSAQNYNQLLKLFNIDSIAPISDGDKIVYTYVKQNPFGFETMALKGQNEDDERLVEFVEKYIDKNKLFETALMSKLSPIWEDLGWGEVQTTEINKFF